MAITKTQKKEILQNLTNTLKSAETVTFVNFHGLGVTETTEMRKALREVGVNYSVVKKTLANRAIKDSGIPGDVPELNGELAIAYGEETSPAREVYSFQKKHQDKLTILGGIFEGHFVDQERMTSIAQIPGLDALRGMFVNIINSPIQRCAIALGQIAEKKA